MVLLRAVFELRVHRGLQLLQLVVDVGQPLGLGLGKCAVAKLLVQGLWAAGAGAGAGQGGTGYGVQGMGLAAGSGVQG